MEAFVEPDRIRIPVKHDPFHAAASAPACFMEAKKEKLPTESPVPIRRVDKDILEIECRKGPERRIGFEENDIADGSAVEKRKVPVEPPPGSRCIAGQTRACGAIRPGEFFEIGECVDKCKKCPVV